MLNIGMVLKSNKTGKTYSVEYINEDNNRVSLNCKEDIDPLENHILSKVIEFIEIGYYTVVSNAEHEQAVRKGIKCNSISALARRKAKLDSGKTVKIGNREYYQIDKVIYCQGVEIGRWEHIEATEHMAAADIICAYWNYKYKEDQQ